MQDRKWFFIVNATAGRGKTGKKINKLITSLNEHKLDFEIELTKAPLHAIQLAQDAIKKGFHNIISVGGDGTLNEVVNGVMLSGKAEEINVGIIPEGGGNDFEKYFHIPHGIEKAIKVLENEKIKLVDVGKFDNTYFINSLGIGFDAKSAIIANKIKWLNGIVRYYTAILVTLITNKPYKLQMKLDDKNINDELLMFSVGNGRFCGGGFQVTPNAIVDDGFFDVCMIKFINRHRILKLLPTVIPGKHLNYSEVTMKRVKKIEINSEKEIPLYFDGEIPKLMNPKKVKIELLHKKLNLIC